MPTCTRGGYSVLHLGYCSRLKPNVNKGIGEQNDMLIKRTEIPSGRESNGKPRVFLRSNGQIALNQQASESVGTGVKTVALDWDEDTRIFTIAGVEGKLPKGVSKEELFGVSYADSSKSLYFGGAGVLRHINYDYKAAGNQGFECEVDAKAHTVSVVIPEKTPTPKPTTPRVKKVLDATAKATNADAAKDGSNGNATVAAGVAGAKKLEDVD